MNGFISFVQAHKPFFDALAAIGTVLNLVILMSAAILLAIALRRRRVESLAIGPFSFRMLKEEAIVATATASRAWQPVSGEKVDVPRIRATIDEVFTPEALNNLTGKAVLWVDDNPANNELAVRALRKFGLDIEQVSSTEAAVSAMERRKFGLVISDMGRGSDMQAGYGLLKLLRDSGSKAPFFIFAGKDKPEFRREAAERGAQLSTNDMLELVDNVVKYLGSAA
jgi:CheY-like chemotaxis protein